MVKVGAGREACLRRVMTGGGGGGWHVPPRRWKAQGDVNLKGVEHAISVTVRGSLSEGRPVREQEGACQCGTCRASRARSQHGRLVCAQYARHLAVLWTGIRVEPARDSVRVTAGLKSKPEVRYLAVQLEIMHGAAY